MADQLSQSANTVIQNAQYQTNRTITLEDWSETSRGFHVGFRPDETVPLVQGE